MTNHTWRHWLFGRLVTFVVGVLVTLLIFAALSTCEKREPSIYRLPLGFSEVAEKGANERTVGRPLMQV